MNKSYSDVLKLSIQAGIKNKHNSKNNTEVAKLYLDNISSNKLFEIYNTDIYEILLTIDKYVKISEFEIEISLLKQIFLYIQKSKICIYDLDFMRDFNNFIEQLSYSIYDIDNKLEKYLWDKFSKKSGCFGSFNNHSHSEYKNVDKKFRNMKLDYTKCVFFHDIVSFLINDKININKLCKKYPIEKMYILPITHDFKINIEYSYIGIAKHELLYSLKYIFDWIQNECSITIFENLENIIKNNLSNYLIPDLSNIILLYLK